MPGSVGGARRIRGARIRSAIPGARLLE